MLRIALLTVSVLLVVGCRGEDADLTNKIVGSWEINGVLETTLSADGRFVTKWTMPTNTNVYQGTWKVKDGVLVSKTSEGENHFRIIQADGTNLVYDANGAKLPLTRKK